MGFNVSFENDDGLQGYLSRIELDSKRTEKEMLKETGEELKKLVVANLNKHRRVITNRYKNRPAMADDVKVSIKTNKWGEKYVSVGGGKMTGTLWHLVNDGNLHSTPTHFMDGALARMDGTIDKLWDKILK